MAVGVVDTAPYYPYDSCNPYLQCKCNRWRSVGDVGIVSTTRDLGVAEIDTATPYIPTMGRVAKIDTMSGNVKAESSISEITYDRVAFFGEWRPPSEKCLDMAYSFSEI